MKRVVKAPGACCSVLLLLLLALLVTCAPAWATTYVVAKNGDGADDKIIYSDDSGPVTSPDATLTALVNNLDVRPATRLRSTSGRGRILSRRR